MKAPIAPSTNQPAMRRLVVGEDGEGRKRSATAPIAEHRDIRCRAASGAAASGVAGRDRQWARRAASGRTAGTSRPKIAAILSRQAASATRARIGRTLAITDWATNGRPAPITSPITTPTRAITAPARDRSRRPARRGAQALQRGDGAQAVDEAEHGVGDAHPADQQRGQPDKRQELRQAVDVRESAGRRPARADLTPSRPPGRAFLATDDGDVGDRRRRAAGRSSVGSHGLPAAPIPMPTPPRTRSGGAAPGSRRRSLSGSRTRLARISKVRRRPDAVAGLRSSQFIEQRGLDDRAPHRPCRRARRRARGRP